MLCCAYTMKSLLRAIVVSIITLEARLVLAKYKPRIIAITGNVGKTSTKDTVYAALHDSLFVRKSMKSFNSDIGVPLTILGCENGWSNPLKWLANIGEGLALILFTNHYPKWLVLEVGADHPGDIERITEWVKPDIAIITALPDVPVHVEFFESPEQVAHEKKFLARALKDDGTLIFAGDEKRTATLRTEFPDAQSLSYGVEPGNDVSASHITVHYDDENGAPAGMHFRVEQDGASTPVVLAERLGHQQIFPVLAALAVAQTLNITAIKALAGMSRMEASKGRMRILAGHNTTTLIDDSYNSSPLALRAAIATLKKIETTGRKIAIVGDMLELGRYSADAHKKAGVHIGGVADVLVTVGVRAKGIAQAAREQGMKDEQIHEFDFGKAQEAGKLVRGMLEPEDVVLVKGSQSIRLEKALKELLADPRSAKDVLVRQEAEWLGR